MLIMSTILHLGKSGMSDKPINDDDVDRIAMCLNVLSEGSELMTEVFNKLCRESLDKMLIVKATEDKQKVSYHISLLSAIDVLGQIHESMKFIQGVYV